ncbi:condensation domain-containing protein [Streptomyces stramineus]
MDPGNPPLLRHTLITLAPRHHRLVLTAHHIVVDGWSVAVLLDELFALYAQESSGPAPRPEASLLPPARPYRDHLAWMAGRDRPAAEHAWRTTLAGLAEPTLIAPPDRVATRPAGTTAESVAVRLAEATGTALRERARRSGMLLNTVFQASWAVVLGEATGRDDVVFGCTVSGRSPELPGSDTMVGLLINTVPVRARLAPGLSLRALGEQLQDQRVGLMEHDHHALTDIQRTTGLQGPLFDTNLAFDNFPVNTSPPCRAGTWRCPSRSGTLRRTSRSP